MSTPVSDAPPHATPHATTSTAAGLAAVLERITDAFFALDGHWRFTYVNDQAQRLLARTREELLGRCVWDEFPDAVGSTFEREYRRAVASGTTVDFQEFFPPLDTWFDVRAYPSADGLSVFFRDVTAQRATAAALAVSERRLRLAMDAARLGSFEWDVASGRVFWSAAIERMHGIPEGSFDGTFEAYQRDMHPDDRARVLATVQASLADGAAHHLDYRIVRPDGAVRWLEAHGQFERDADGRVARLIGVCRDVTEQQAAREQLRLVTESIPVQVWTAGPDGGLDYVSARTTAYFGASEADLLGNGWATRVHPDDIAAAAQQWAHALATGEPYETEFRLQRADGAYRWHLARALPLRDAHGRLARWFGSNTDVDDRFVAERERDRALAEAERRADELARLATALERSNQELDQFAYVTSHDLKAPLRGIANLTQWIEEDLGDRVTGESREHMRLLKGRVHRMEALIDGILAYARAGRTRVAPEPVDTNALLREVVELLDAGAQARIAIADDLPTVVAERVPLQQVFLNLLGNAVRFSAAHRPDPVVRVGWRDAGDVVEFWVADNGPGIAPEFQERVWGIFQTLQARDKVEGTGIGLAVVRKIVDSRGGRAWLDSAPGKGTTFYIAVPRIAPCDPADAGCA